MPDSFDFGVNKFHAEFFVRTDLFRTRKDELKGIILKGVVD